MLKKCILSAMLREKEVPKAIDVPKITLLEQLRKKLVEPHPTKTSERAELLKDLIVQHRNEFPSLFRGWIDLMLEKHHDYGVNCLDYLYVRTLHYFFTAGWYKDSDTEEELELLLRLLVSWYPRVLRDCNSSSAWESWDQECGDLECGVTLLYEFIFWNGNAKDKTLIFPLFETILELGMQYFPTELGFLFHGQTFRIACELFGTERIVELVSNHIFNKLMRNSNKNKTLTRWIVEAASHDIVSLDCLYTLVRWDPPRCIKLFSTPNQKRRNSCRFPSKGKKRKFVQQSIAVWLNRVETLST